ncbi:hypothetical protein [Amycolatopsis anabasis]|uniref:hypothetical protein n=1 Tax=Amycolatopsis anabasis TaxID=1840409 RepID=UPI00131D334B|nr:hypothetical protein [Amycolatopsis anabasis]
MLAVGVLVSGGVVAPAALAQDNPISEGAEQVGEGANEAAQDNPVTEGAEAAEESWDAATDAIDMDLTTENFQDAFEVPDEEQDVLVHELAAACIEGDPNATVLKSPAAEDSGVCDADSTYQDDFNTNLRATVQTAVADNDLQNAVRQTPGISYQTPTSEEAAGLVLEKVGNSPTFKRDWAALKPSKGAWVATAVNVGTTLADGNASTQDLVTAATSNVPIAGQVIGFADAGSKRDIEGMWLNTAALGGVAAALSNPALGATVGAGLAAYEIGKVVHKTLLKQQSGRDWTQNPPQTVQELVQAGMKISMTGHKDATIDVSKGSDAQTLIFDSKLSDTTVTDQPRVSYTLKGANSPEELGTQAPILFTHPQTHGVAIEKITFFQDGKAVEGKCVAVPTGFGGGPNGADTELVMCAPAHDIKVTQDNPVKVDIAWKDNKQMCQNIDGCGTVKETMTLNFIPDNGEPVEMDLPIHIRQ